ncbi:site-specific integrase [Mucilaginibacter gilvus]|uniref:hypothetical protein n=1 Tax=Mucilaginibacter gilvus TaxID=2305909 RepID=UPI00141949BD|nr:hypothetical protein [Mucilaginibacter gilvus]
MEKYVGNYQINANYHIKITREANKLFAQLISAHTARRSFAINMYLMGASSIAIMAIIGHRTEKTFLKYFKATPKEHSVCYRKLVRV